MFFTVVGEFFLVAEALEHDEITNWEYIDIVVKPWAVALVLFVVFPIIIFSLPFAAMHGLFKWEWAKNIGQIFDHDIISPIGDFVENQGVWTDVTLSDREKYVFVRGCFRYASRQQKRNKFYVKSEVVSTLEEELLDLREKQLILKIAQIPEI